ncbi:hypothetical protein Tco_0118752, partial [Tanacetum coccineum]
ESRRKGGVPDDGASGLVWESMMGSGGDRDNTGKGGDIGSGDSIWGSGGEGIWGNGEDNGGK